MSDFFPISVGQTIAKKAIHQLLGGSDQHGMTSCLNGSQFLVFHNETVGKEFGYDRWEGWQADGSFHYTGQGVHGDQKFTRSNKSLLKMANEGRPIHLFRTAKKSSPYVYVGLVSLGDPQFVLRTAPDKSGADRQVIVFHLLPIGHVDVPPIEVADCTVEILESIWIPPLADPIFPTRPSMIPAQIDLEEMKLQTRFGDYLKAKGESVKTISISISGQNGIFKPDFYLETRNWIVEAKPSASREYVRLAIGQVLDYSHLLEKSGNKKEPAILLPMSPPNDLVELISRLNIHLIIETEVGEYIFSD